MVLMSISKDTYLRLCELEAYIGRYGLYSLPATRNGALGTACERLFRCTTATNRASCEIRSGTPTMVRHPRTTWELLQLIYWAFVSDPRSMLACTAVPPSSFKLESHLFSKLTVNMEWEPAYRLIATSSCSTSSSSTSSH